MLGEVIILHLIFLKISFLREETGSVIELRYWAQQMTKHKLNFILMVSYTKKIIYFLIVDIQAGMLMHVTFVILMEMLES